MKIIETRKILSQIDNELEGIEFISDGRNDISLALFDISFDHSKSILILCESGIFSSAYALARPMFECFVRAAWLQYCASDRQIENIKKKDNFPLSLGELIKAVETNNDWPKGLSSMKKLLIKNMNSYTHGGMQLAARHFSGLNLVHIPDRDEVNALLRMLSIISFLSFFEIVKISDTKAKDEFIKNIYEEIDREILDIKNL